MTDEVWTERWIIIIIIIGLFKQGKARQGKGSEAKRDLAKRRR